MLHLQLFGSPHVEQDGILVESFRSRKIEALFYYLVVNRGTHRRSKLAALLWPDTSEEKALRNLRYALWNLRQILGEIPLHSDRISISLPKSDLLTVDTEILDTLVAHDSLKQNQDDAALIPQLERAATLYHGEFLAGFELEDDSPFTDWLQGQRLRYEQVIVEVFKRLAVHYITQRQLPDAMKSTRRLLELDPWHEKAHRQLLTLMAITGHREMAVTHYQQLAQTLEAELGIEPEPETIALIERIRSGQVAAQNDEPSSELTERGISAESNTQTIPLIGRRKEYAQLTKHWENATTEDSGLLLIRGIAGVGKTRLVEELSHYVNLRGGLVLKGRCYEFSGSLPFHAIAMALESQIKKLNIDDSPKNQMWLNELGQLLPELRPSEFGVHPHQTQRQVTDPYRLFEAIVHVIDAMTQDQPLLLAIDDLHWADSETLDLLGYLVRRLSSSALLIVGTYRPDEVTTDHALVAMRRPLYNAGLDHEINLESLSFEAIEELVGVLDSAESNPNLTLFLHEISQGNPFILFETINEMRERSWLGKTANATDNIALPDHCLIDVSISSNAKLHVLCSEDAECQDEGKLLALARPLEITASVPDAVPNPAQLQLAEVKARIARRIARLPAHSRQLLATAALSGHPFDLKMLQLASGLSTFDVLDCLEDWIARHLVIEVDQSASVTHGPSTTNTLLYDFSHDLIRSVSYHGLSQLRKQAVHLQLGNALEQLYAGRVDHIVERLAYHFHQAREAPKALHFLHLAGKQARTVYALSIAQERFQHALEYWEQINGGVGAIVPKEAWRIRWELLYSLNEVNRILGQQTSQDLLLETVIDEVPHWGDERDRLRMIEQQLAQLESSADLNQRRLLAREGLRSAHALGDLQTEAKFLLAWADCDRDMGNHEDAAKNYEKAIGHFTALDQTPQLVLSLIGQGTIHMLNNRYGQALATLENASTRARKDGCQDVLVSALYAVAELSLYLGNLDGALNVSQNALTICKQYGLNSELSPGLVTQANVHLLNDDLEMAEQLLDRAWEITRESGKNLRMADVQCSLGHLRMAQRQYKLALQHFDKTEDLSGSFYHGRAIEARSFRAIAHLRLDELNEALVASHHAMVWLGGREHVLHAPQRICWNQHVVMLAHWEAVEAQEALVKGFRLLRSQLETIGEAYPESVSESEIRTRFLTNLPWNNEINTMWEMLPLTNSHSALHFAG